MTDTTTTTGSAEGEGGGRPLSRREPPHRRPRRDPAVADDARGEGRPLLPDDDHHRRGRRARRRRPHVRPALDRGVRARARHDPLQRARRGADRPPDGRVAQPPAGAGRDDPPRHPRHALDRPAPLVQRQPRRRDHARARSRSGPRRSASRRSATRRLVDALRRHRPPGVHGRRHPRGAAPAGRPRHRAALVAPGRDVRRGRRARRAAWAPPTSAGSRAPSSAPTRSRP